MEKFNTFFIFVIFSFILHLNCLIFEANSGITTVLPHGPIINLNYTHTKFQKKCSAGTCTYILSVPGMSNKISNYIEDKINNDMIIEATEETITQKLNDDINLSLTNIQNEINEIESKLNNLTSIYNNLLNTVETIEVDLDETNEALTSIQLYVDEMNKTSSENALYQCYVKAYESCSESQSTTVKIPLSSTMSSIQSTVYVSKLSTEIQSTASPISTLSTEIQSTASPVSTLSTKIQSTASPISTLSGMSTASGKTQSTQSTISKETSTNIPTTPITPTITASSNTHSSTVK
uniref:Nsp1_C domain-containing protein n=1 Tax=Strongyloides stercoralis TaxID=6248 RepID=A0A0K0EFP4_STRER